MFWKYFRNDFLFFVYKSIQKNPESNTKFNSKFCVQIVRLSADIKKKIMSNCSLDEFLAFYVRTSR